MSIRGSSPAIALIGVLTIGAAQSPKSGVGVDPCSLVTKQEAAAAVGGAVGDGKSTVVDTKTSPAMLGGGSCQYESPSSTHYLKINVYRYVPQVAAAYRKRCAQKETVPGIGDVACWYDSKHGELQLLKGTTSLAIQINRSGDASDALKTVARQAAARLP